MLSLRVLITVKVCPRGVDMSSMKYLVTYVMYECPDVFTDHYEAFDTLEDAMERYEELLELFKDGISKVWSANVSKVLRSTDYL